MSLLREHRRQFAELFTDSGKLKFSEKLTGDQRAVLYALQTRCAPNDGRPLRHLQRELEAMTKGKKLSRLYHGLRAYMTKGMNRRTATSAVRYIHAYFSMVEDISKEECCVVLVFLLTACRHKNLLAMFFTAMQSKKYLDEVDLPEYIRDTVGVISLLDTITSSKKFLKQFALYKYAYFLEKLTLRQIARAVVENKMLPPELTQALAWVTELRI